MEELERQMASEEAETGLDGGEDGDGSGGICHHLNTYPLVNKHRP